MEFPFSWLRLLYFCTLLTVPASSLDELENVGRRVLMGFKETPKGSNRTFECSPSGPCVPCLYSEKKDDKYRCSETGFRIPLNCAEVEENPKGAADGKKTKKSRSSLEISLGNPDSKNRRILEENTSQEGYITYRSCIPAVSEEKMSVLGFEATVFCFLIISGSGVYLRRKRTVSMSGVASGRIQNNSRL